MLHFSVQALNTIQNAIQARTSPPGGLRVGVMGSACSGLQYVIRLEEAPSSDDQIIECQGLSVFVDFDSVSRLEGVRVDFIEDGDRRGFTFDNPHVAQGCSGCDKSK